MGVTTASILLTISWLTTFHAYIAKNSFVSTTDMPAYIPLDSSSDNAAQKPPPPAHWSLANANRRDDIDRRRAQITRAEHVIVEKRTALASIRKQLREGRVTKAEVEDITEGMEGASSRENEKLERWVEEIQALMKAACVRRCALRDLYGQGRRSARERARSFLRQWKLISDEIEELKEETGNFGAPIP